MLEGFGETLVLIEQFLSAGGLWVNEQMKQAMFWPASGGGEAGEAGGGRRRECESCGET